VPEMEVEEVPEGDFLEVEVGEMVPLWVCPTRDTVASTVWELLSEAVTDREGEWLGLPLRLGLTLGDTDSELAPVLLGLVEVVRVLQLVPLAVLEAERREEGLGMGEKDAVPLPEAPEVTEGV
jgi:hypothetical protein